MSRIATRIATFLRGSRGQRLVQKVERYAARPENQRRLAQLRQRLADRRRPPRPE